MFLKCKQKSFNIFYEFSFMENNESVTHKCVGTYEFSLTGRNLKHLPFILVMKFFEDDLPLALETFFKYWYNCNIVYCMH